MSRQGLPKPGCTLAVGQSQLKFNAREEEVQIVPVARGPLAGGLIGGNAKMREIYTIIEKIAPTATTVVIDGETGTGKEVVAQSIHSLSPRARNELVVFDCGAVPPNLIESELFGHRSGRGDEPRRVCSSSPTAARCSSTSSASCRSICSRSSCVRSSSARSGGSAATKAQKVDRPDHRHDEQEPRR